MSAVGITNDLMAKVRRDRETEEKVRKMDASEIVEWVHRLEDQIADLERDVESLNDALQDGRP